MNGTNCSASCPIGQYGNLLTGLCENCLTGCGACTYGDLNHCSNCTGDYFLIPNTTCSQSCAVLGDNYYGDKSTNRCLPCGPNCVTCVERANNCTKCNGTLNLFNNSCNTYCPLGYVASSNECKKCSDGCSNCTGIGVNECVACADGYFFKSNTCADICGDGYSKDLLNSIDRVCKRCEQVTECKLCEDNSKFNCYECNTGFYLYNKRCIDTCPGGTFESGQICAACNPACETCSAAGSDKCITCKPGYFFTGPSKCETFCLEGFLQNNFTHICEACQSNCLNCSVSVVNCTACPTNYYLLNNKCTSSCPDRYYAKAVDQICDTCAPECVRCNAPLNTNCSECNATYVLLNSSCISPSLCGDFYFGNLTSKLCQKCQLGCQRCSYQPTNCSLCIENYYLSGNFCVSTC